jgi:hypothetical protein
VPAILDKILRIGEGKIVRQLEAIAKAVNAIEDEFVAMSDEELRDQTDEFKKRLEEGETLDDLMPEAFATVREAAKPWSPRCRRTSTRSPATASTSSPSTTTWRSTTPSGWGGCTTSWASASVSSFRR